MVESIKGLKDSAELASKRARNYFVESRAIMDADGQPLTPEKIQCAIALNQRAIDEAKKALNTFKFLTRYLAEEEH